MAEQTPLLEGSLYARVSSMPIGLMRDLMQQFDQFVISVMTCSFSRRPHIFRTNHGVRRGHIVCLPARGLTRRLDASLWRMYSNQVLNLKPD